MSVGDDKDRSGGDGELSLLWKPSINDGTFSSGEGDPKDAQVLGTNEAGEGSKY